MICKKCGGIYDDDMQKCMWCDAPNENPDQSTDAQEAETAESALQECEVCSKKAVFWLKFFFIVNLIWLIVFISSNLLYKDFGDLQFTISQMGFAYIAGSILFSWFVSVMSIVTLKFSNPPVIFLSWLEVLLSVVFCICVIKCCSWVYSAVKAQRHFSKTRISPDSAAFSGLIPFVFPFAHYFIFTNLLALQKENLDNKSLKYKKISNLNLWAIPIFGTFVHIGFFVIINFDMWVTSVFLSYILIACYIKIIRVITANVSTLHSLASATSPTADTSSDFPDASSSTPDAPSADAPCGSAASSELCKSSPASDEPNNDTPSDTSNNELDHDTPDNPQRLA